MHSVRWLGAVDLCLLDYLRAGRHGAHRLAAAPGTRRAYAPKVAKRIAPRTAASKGSAIACRVRPAALHGVLVALVAVVSLPPFAVALHPRARASICGFRVIDRGRPPLAASPSRGMEDVVEDPARPCARGVLAEIVAVVAIALLALACAIRARPS